MADPVAITQTIVRIALMIKEAAGKVQRNVEECQGIQTEVDTVREILLPLQQRPRVLKNNVGMSRALDQLNETLERALELVRECEQGQNLVLRMVKAENLSKQLQEVKEDITRKLNVVSNAMHTQNTLLIDALVGHPPSQRQQVLLELGQQMPDEHKSQRVSTIINPNVTSSSIRSSLSLTQHMPEELGPPRTGTSLRRTQNEARYVRPFSLHELTAATDNFSNESIIHRYGGFIYKGKLDGVEVAIKKHESIDLYIAQEGNIQDKINLFSELDHQSIVRPLGYCCDGPPELTFYSVEEYMPNGSMDKIINGSSIHWSSCFGIIQGIARGVHYLHEQHIVHLNLKPSIILLDSDNNPKIGDSLLYTRLDHGDAEICSHTEGSMGYIAPEYLKQHIVSVKCDVYAFGITLLEIISSICKPKLKPQGGVQNVAGWAWSAWNDRMEKFLRQSLYVESELMQIERCTRVGLLCVQPDRKDRPTMADVLAMLNGEKDVPAPRKPT